MNKRIFNNTATKHIQLNKRLCEGCWKCVEVCPNHVIDKINLPFHKHAVISITENCTGCRKCANVCSKQAISVI